MTDRDGRASAPDATAQENADIRLILDGTAAETGAQFFHALVSNLAKVLGTAGAWVTEYLPESRRLNARAMWYKGEFIADYEYDIAGTPCEPVIEKQCLVHIPKGVSVRFPDDPDLDTFGAVSYMGMPLLGHDGAVIGHLAVLDTKPMPHQDHMEDLFRIFGARAGAELRRLRAENEAREREEQLVRLVDSAMDAILELDHQWHVTRANRAVTKTFGYAIPAVLGKSIEDLLDSGSADKLRRLTDELNRNPDGPHSLWIPGGFKAINATGDPVSVEGSLSRFDHAGATFYTLILHDLNDKIKAERRIVSLEHETEYLREELADLHNFRSIIGTSPALKQTLAAVRQVAGTDSTVLILGETGTGKELIARAIHSESKRHDRPLIKVNCAAIPAALIESEFFGHERGAFTGATQRRQGRFTLADGGTIFLDEVGELPIDLQAKLLRVLQEGELEPVGSSRTIKVDVRVIAATNRDLKQAVKDGTFREDLYYRLNVIPITAPALRERGDDVILLAESFARSFSQQTGRPVEPISASCRDALLSYPWPGNIRELQNVIERAVITSRHGHLNIAGIIPLETPPQPSQHRGTPDTVLTDDQIRRLERANIERALSQAGGKLSGDSGAAALLGIPPSTLASRMKALKIGRPA